MIKNNLKIHYEIKPSFTTRKIKELEQENKQLKDNWNKLKEHLKEKIAEGRSTEHLWLMGCYDEDKLILEKMQELEQGSDSNVKD